MDILRDLWTFIVALYNKWSAIFLGSTVAVGLGLWFGFGKTIPRFWYAAIVFAIFLWSVFRVWRDNHHELHVLSETHRILVAYTKEERIQLEEKLRLAQVRIQNLEAQAATSKQAALWHPRAALNQFEKDGELWNELVLKDDHLFQVDSVQLLGPNDALLAELSLGPPDLKKEYHLRITQQNLLTLNHRHLSNGSVRYRASRGEAHCESSLPFILEDKALPMLGRGGIQMWIAMVG